MLVTSPDDGDVVYGYQLPAQERWRRVEWFDCQRLDVGSPVLFSDSTTISRGQGLWPIDFDTPTYHLFHWCN